MDNRSGPTLDQLKVRGAAALRDTREMISDMHQFARENADASRRSRQWRTALSVNAAFAIDEKI